MLHGDAVDVAAPEGVPDLAGVAVPDGVTLTV